MRSPWRVLAVSVLVCGVAAVVHGPALGGDFVYDDQRFVALNPALGSLTHVGSFFTDPSTVDPEGNWEGIYRPLRSLSYAVDHAFFGVNPVGYHVHNLLLHIAASLALGVLLGRLLRQTTLGLVLGVLFLVHPANVESVAWITSRADLQAGLLAFLTLLVMRSTGRGATILGTTLLALAVFAKESAVVVPVLGVLLARRFPTGRARSWRADMRRWAPGLAVVIVYLVIRQVVLGEHGGQRTFWGDRWSTTAASMVTGLGWYVWRFLLPVGFRFDYQLPLQTSWLDPAVWLLGAALAGGVLLAVFSVVRGGRLVSVGAGVWWFLIALGPVSNVVVPINILVAERFLYLPAAGGLLAVGGAGLVLSRRGAGWRVAAIGVAGVFFVVWAVTAHTFARVWTDEARLWTAVVDHSPDHYRGYHGLAKATILNRSGPGDLARDMDTARRWLQEAVARCHGVHAELYFDWGRTYLLEKRHRESVPCFRQAVELWRKNRKTAYNLAYRRTLDLLEEAYQMEGNPTEARRMRAWADAFDRAVSLGP